MAFDLTHDSSFLQSFSVLLLGTLIGSFLNSCIYRLPRNLSLCQPICSFCPHCQYPIPWIHQIPLFSWLWLKGQCTICHHPIAVRYLLVELFTAGIFWVLFLVWGWPLWIPYTFFATFLITSSAIDIEHGWIPNSLTWGGAGVGIVLSSIFPQMHRIADPVLYAELNRDFSFPPIHLFFLSKYLSPPLFSGIAAICGAGLGYGMIWLLRELGKKAWGKSFQQWDDPQPFHLQWDWQQTSLSYPLQMSRRCPLPKFTLLLGTEVLNLDVILLRSTDVMILECEHFHIDLQSSSVLQISEQHTGPKWESPIAYSFPIQLHIRQQGLFIRQSGSELLIDLLNRSPGEAFSSLAKGRQDAQKIQYLKPYPIQNSRHQPSAAYGVNGCIHGICSAGHFPREAIGLGDAKLMACLGAFLGASNAVFVLCTAAMLGSSWALILYIFRRPCTTLPFAPFLTVAAFLVLVSRRFL